jgi:vacuolar-type H+-ATPase subunit H
LEQIFEGPLLMTEPNEQTFRLLDPDGQEIMSGPMSMIMEHMPDTNARNSALEEAVRAATQAVEAEQKLEDARACAAQIISDTVNRLTERLDQYVAHQEEQQRRDAEEAERQEQERIEAELTALPDPDNQPLVEPDDGDLEIKHEVEAERYGPGEDDAEPEVKAALSYPPIPTSYVKGKRDAEGDLPEGLVSRSPPPLGNYPVYDPADLGKPEDPKQVPQPIAPSLW